MWLNGAITQLPLPENGYGIGKAMAVNNRNHIVGFASNTGANSITVQPLLWRDGQVTSLPVPEGQTQASAMFLNDRDQIVGASACLIPRAHYFGTTARFTMC